MVLILSRDDVAVALSFPRVSCPNDLPTAFSDTHYTEMEMGQITLFLLNV